MVLNASVNNISVIIYRDGQFYLLRKPEKTIDLSQVTKKLSHTVVSTTPRLSGVQTHYVSGDRS